MILNFFVNIFTSLINFITIFNNESILLLNTYNGCENYDKYNETL